jgi:hypothetical protein
MASTAFFIEAAAYTVMDVTLWACAGWARSAAAAQNAAKTLVMPILSGRPQAPQCVEYRIGKAQSAAIQAIRRPTIPVAALLREFAEISGSPAIGPLLLVAACVS